MHKLTTTCYALLKLIFNDFHCNIIATTPCHLALVHLLIIFSAIFIHSADIGIGKMEEIATGLFFTSLKWYEV